MNEEIKELAKLKQRICEEILAYRESKQEGPDLTLTLDRIMTVMEIFAGYRKPAPSEKLEPYDYHKEDDSITEGLTLSKEFTEAFHKRLGIEEILSGFWQKSKDSKTPDEFQTHLHSAARSIASLLPEMKRESFNLLSKDDVLKVIGAKAMGDKVWIEFIKAIKAQRDFDLAQLAADRRK